MSQAGPRIHPLRNEEFKEEHQNIAVKYLSKERSEFNIIRTLARVPEALEPFLTWAGYVLSGTSLPDRERELITVRVAHLTRSTYELSQHVKMSFDAGLTADEFKRIRLGADAGWSAADAALIRACDELLADQVVSDAVWQSLTDHFILRQVMDVVITIGQYSQLAMILNSFRVEVEPSLRAQVAEFGYDVDHIAEE